MVTEHVMPQTTDRESYKRNSEVPSEFVSSYSESGGCALLFFTDNWRMIWVDGSSDWKNGTETLVWIVFIQLSKIQILKNKILKKPIVNVCKQILADSMNT